MAVRPTQAAFYSAVMPGLGQWYNKDYWQVPVVWTALGGSLYFYVYNQDKFDEYRSLYKMKKVDPSATEYTFDWLERAQKYYKKKKDFALMLSAGVYALQIVWAGVEAHLDYFDTDKNLGMRPVIIPPPAGSVAGAAPGLSITLTW